MALRVDGNIPRIVKLSVLGALLAEFEEEGPVKGEHLDAVVVLVSHDDAT